MAYFNGKKDFLIALQGESSKWYSGTGITGDGTANNAVNSTNSGITLAKKFDMYLNTETYNVYACISGGTWERARWTYLCNIKGTQGEKGDGGTSAQWYTGTLYTETNPGVLIGGGFDAFDYANVGDMYLNEDTADVYRCIAGGGPVEASWLHVTNIKGGQGEQGPQGEQGIQGESTQWYTGKHYTNGTSGNLIGSSTYPFETANVGDMYLNEDTGYVYRCTKGGNWVESVWYRCTNIKGDSVELTTQFDNNADGKAADAGAVRDALRNKVGSEDFNTLKDVVNRTIYPVEDPDIMDGILSEDPEKVLDKIYMYVGPTTAKYKTGGVYKLTEEVID